MKWFGIVWLTLLCIGLAIVGIPLQVEGHDTLVERYQLNSETHSHAPLILKVTCTGDISECEVILKEIKEVIE